MITTTLLNAIEHVLIGATFQHHESKAHDSDQRYLPANILSARGSSSRWQIEVFLWPFPQTARVVNKAAVRDVPGHHWLPIVSTTGFTVTFKGEA